MAARGGNVWMQEGKMDAGWGWWGKKEPKVTPVHPEQKEDADDDNEWEENKECCSDYQEQIDAIVKRLNEITQQETELRVKTELLKTKQTSDYKDLERQLIKNNVKQTRLLVHAIDEESAFRHQDIKKQNLVIGQQNLFLSDIGKYPSNQIGSSNPLKPLLKRIENAEKMNKSIFTHSHEIEDIKLILKSMADRIHRLEPRETS